MKDWQAEANGALAIGSKVVEFTCFWAVVFRTFE